jgi:hypothetical protein
MGIARGPNIITDGLVFGYDDCYNGSGEQMASGRYFKGPAHTNLLEEIDPSITNTTNANFSAVSGEEVVDIPIVGKRTVKYVDYFNNYPTGGTCCPNLFHYHASDGQIPVDASTIYTYSIIYKHSNNYTHPNFMYRYEYQSDGTYNTEAGFHSTASDRRTHLGNGWYHAWGSFTTQSTTSYVVCYSFLYNYGTATYRYSVAAISLVKNESGQTHFIIPPQLMLEPLGSVSNTASLIDLKRTNSIDVSNMSFTLTGQPEMDGSSDYIDLGSDIEVSSVANAASNGWTAEYVFNSDSASTLQHFNGCEEDVHNAGWLALLSSKLAVWDRTSNVWKYGDTVFASNTWYHVAFVQLTGTTMQFYVNGIAEGGDHVSFSWTAAKSAFFARYIGRYEYNGGYSRYFNGHIPVTRLYNKAQLKVARQRKDRRL